MRSDGNVGDEPPSAWDKYKAAGGTGREQFNAAGQLNSTFRTRYYGETCCLCDGGGTLQLCRMCPNTAHQKCIEKTLWDCAPPRMGSEAPTWACTTCRRTSAEQRHDKRCYRCLEHYFVIEDLARAIDALDS